LAALWQILCVILGVALLLGLIIGSFLNVCIVRIPRGESIVRPPSHCTGCGREIRPYDNIPVISWLVLGGKCRVCKTAISWMYPTVELVTGLLFLACAAAFGPTLLGVKWAILSALVITLVATDIRERILPDKINFFGLAVAIVISGFLPPADGVSTWLSSKMFDFPPPMPVLSVADSLLGALVGGGLLWVVAEGYFRLRGREGMGLGDVKMMAMVGAFVGLEGTLLAILIGSLLGSVIGLAFIAIFRKGQDYELPFGAFLGAGTMIVVFFGTRMLDWYQTVALLR
jgi:leader peptidase (prepilin peptidase) / N-methyltransferase